MATIGYTNQASQDFAVGTAVDAAYSVKITAPEDGKITSITAYTRVTSGTKTLKGVIWNSSFDVAAIGGTVNVTNTIASYKTTTFSVPYDITTSTIYYIGFVVTNSAALMFRYSNNIPAAYFGYDFTNNYTNPQSIVDVSQDSDIVIYATYTPSPPGPSLLVEGITPGKVEGTDWGDISDIY